MHPQMTTDGDINTQVYTHTHTHTLQQSTQTSSVNQSLLTNKLTIDTVRYFIRSGNRGNGTMYHWDFFNYKHQLNYLQTTKVIKYHNNKNLHNLTVILWIKLIINNDKKSK